LRATIAVSCCSHRRHIFRRAARPSLSCRGKGSQARRATQRSFRHIEYLHNRVGRLRVNHRFLIQEHTGRSVTFFLSASYKTRIPRICVERTPLMRGKPMGIPRLCVNRYPPYAWRSYGSHRRVSQQPIAPSWPDHQAANRTQPDDLPSCTDTR
jgi:hypothetical protein